MSRINKCISLLLIIIIGFNFISIFAIGDKDSIQDSKFKIKNAPITVESNVDKADITIGDLIKYTLIVTYDSSIKVQTPPVGANLGEFEIKDYKIFDAEIKESKIINKSEYIITTFTTGDYIIPPVIMGYIEPHKSPKEIQSQKIFIRVHKVSSKQKDKDDIRGLKNVTELKITYLYYYIGGLLLLVCLIGGILGYGYYKKHQKKHEQIIEEIKKSPHELATEKINELRNSDLLKTGRIKEFFIILSEILRKYIEGRYGIIAMDRTTFEIIAEMKSSKINSDNINAFRDIFEFSDLVKFAKLLVDINESGKILNLSEEIVNKTNIKT